MHLFHTPYLPNKHELIARLCCIFRLQARAVRIVDLMKCIDNPSKTGGLGQQGCRPPSWDQGFTPLVFFCAGCRYQSRAPGFISMAPPLSSQIQDLLIVGTRRYPGRPNPRARTTSCLVIANLAITAAIAARFPSKLISLRPETPTVQARMCFSACGSTLTLALRMQALTRPYR